MTTNHASGHQCETYSEAIFIEDSQSITQVGSTLICIGNDGAKVADTNYFDTGFARLGLMFLSVNANAVRLLIPDSQWHFVKEMKTGKVCVITRGNLKGKDLLELMFDDGSRAPFALYIEASMCDHPNLMGSFEVTAWTRSGQVGQWTGHYRVAKKLPCLQPWKTPKSNSQTHTFNRR